MPKPKVTEERRAQLKSWTYKFFEEVWERKWTPPSDFQSQLINYLVRDDISDESLKIVWDDTAAWMRHFRQEEAAGKKIILPCASVWYNEHRYDNPIPSAMEAKNKRELGKCQCGEEVIGERFVHCYRCLPDPKKKEKYEALGEYKKKPDESVQEWRERCRIYGKQKLYGLIKGLSSVS